MSMPFRNYLLLPFYENILSPYYWWLHVEKFVKFVFCGKSIKRSDTVNFRKILLNLLVAIGVNSFGKRFTYRYIQYRMLNESNVIDNM